MMSVLGACWHRPILGNIEEFLEELKQRRKTGERIGNKGKAALEKEEKAVSRKAVTKWKNCCRVVGKWTNVDLEQRLDRGPTYINSRRKWTNLIRLGLWFL
jgi:hypothetical protein